MLAYSERRADAAFPALLDAAQADSWMTFPVDMLRQITLVDDLRGIVRLRNAIACLRPDIVHAHSSKAGAIARLAAASLPKRSFVIYSPHALAFRLNPTYLAIERMLAPLTDRFAAVSEGERDEIVSCGLAEPSRVSVVTPFIDSVYYEPRCRDAARQSLNLGEYPLLVAVGRMTDQKDPLAFLSVVKRVRACAPDTRAIWVGDGELRGEVEREIEHQGLRSVVQIAGWQPDVRPYVAAADVLVSVARYESFGYTVAEALAMERPVVASAVTGTTNILTGPLRLLLFPKDDHQAAADRIVSLFRYPARAASLACAGRKMVEERYSSAAMGEALEQLYASVTAPRGMTAHSPGASN